MYVKQAHCVSMTRMFCCVTGCRRKKTLLPFSLCVKILSWCCLYGCSCFKGVNEAVRQSQLESKCQRFLYGVKPFHTTVYAIVSSFVWSPNMLVEEKKDQLLVLWPKQLQWCTDSRARNRKERVRKKKRQCCLKKNVHEMFLYDNWLYYCFLPCVPILCSFLFLFLHLSYHIKGFPL